MTDHELAAMRAYRAGKPLPWRQEVAPAPRPLSAAVRTLRCLLGRHDWRSVQTPDRNACAHCAANRWLFTDSETGRPVWVRMPSDER